jgi:hypothetical protein
MSKKLILILCKKHPAFNKLVHEVFKKIQYKNQ